LEVKKQEAEAPKQRARKVKKEWGTEQPWQLWVGYGWSD